MLRGFTLLFFVCLLPACTSTRVQHLYDGPPRDASEVARIRVPDVIKVTHVDGARVKRTYALGGGMQELYVMLGEHVIKAHYAIVLDVSDWDHVSFQSDDAQFSFTAHAGKIYAIHFDPPSQDVIEHEMTSPVDIWIEDNEGSRISRRVTHETSYTHKTSLAMPAATPQQTAVSAMTHDAAELIQLKAWWMAADEADRNAFLDWIRTEK